MVTHSQNLFDPVTGKHTNDIESYRLWVKTSFQNMRPALAKAGFWPKN